MRKVRFEGGRLVYLGSSTQEASKHDIEAFLGSQGFHDSVFYWWNLDRLKPVSSEHDGQCAIEFASEGQAQDALRKLFNVPFKANHLYTDKLKLIQVSAV